MKDMVNLQASRRFLLVNMDLKKLGKDLNLNRVRDQKWLSVVESFIESVENKNELMQLLCITQLHVNNPEDTQLFSKSFFRLNDGQRLEEICINPSVSREEYYDTLLAQTGHFVDAKIRLTFSIGDVRYLFDFVKDSKLTFMQIESDAYLSEDQLRDSLECLQSIEVFEESCLSLEEWSYQQCSDYVF